MVTSKGPIEGRRFICRLVVICGLTVMMIDPTLLLGAIVAVATSIVLKKLDKHLEM
jgi:hypothetical protein